MKVKTKFGLNEKVYKQILESCKKYTYEFLIFGSRARGDYRVNSDI